MNRRTFLAASAAGVSAAASYSFAASLSDKPKRVALIGCGWYGKTDLLRLVQVAPVDVVALCDPDRRMSAAAAKLVAERQASRGRSAQEPPTYVDYRELLQNHQPEIVLVGTPDHWHALPMIAAVESGADVYVQKPISVDVLEGAAMVAAARKHDRVVQVGTQRRSTPHLVEARDRVVREGKLGKVAYAEVYCYYHMRTRDNPPDEAPPEHLDWEMWTGPAPMRPYNRIAHPRGWRAFTEYGNGIVGDMCIHMLDTLRWMMELGWPKRITSSGGILMDPGSKANISDTQTATFEFAEFPVNWTHRTWGSSPDPNYPWGLTIYGEKGTLKASIFSYDYESLDGKEKLHGDHVLQLDEYPEDKTEPDLEIHAAPANRAHQRDFLQAIADRSKPVADIEQGYISSASCILANLSARLGRTLVWDAANNRVAGDDEANRLLKRPYREPWQHPAG